MADGGDGGQQWPPLVVAVDLDEVLGYFVATLVRFHNEAYGMPPLTVDDFVSYDFIEVWGGTREESNAKVMAFFESSHFQEELPTVPGAFEALQALKAKGGLEFHLVTSRQFRIQPETEVWIAQHYPSIFTQLHYGNHYSESGAVRSKGEMCEAIGAKLLIDDSLKYALQVAGDAGIEVLLFGDYPWNQPTASGDGSDGHGNGNKSLHPLVTRVTSWDQVQARIEALWAAHHQDG